MNARLETVYKRLKAAAAIGRPEDAFGKLKGTTMEERLASAKIVFRQLAKIAHSDKYIDAAERAVATEAFKLLGELRVVMEDRVKVGLYGSPTKTTPPAPKKAAPIVIVSGKLSVVVGDLLHKGATTAIYDGSAQLQGAPAQAVLVKVVSTDRDNDLLEREAKALKAMIKKAKAGAADATGKKLAEQALFYIPTLIASIAFAEPGKKGKRVANVFQKTPKLEQGWSTLEEVRAAYPDGVSTRVAAFIWNRMLEGLIFAHSAGIIHGALTPNHVLVHAQSHAGRIIDWTAACTMGTGEAPPYAETERFPGFHPAEIIDPAGMPSPASDIYMVAALIVYILGGDPKDMTLPSTVEDPFKELLNRCLQPKRTNRPGAALEVYNKFRRVREDLFGPPKFVEFRMPKASAGGF